MEPGKPAADYTLEIFADPSTVRDIVRGEQITRLDGRAERHR